MRGLSEVIRDSHMTVEKVLLLTDERLERLELANVELAGMLQTLLGLR